MKLFLVVFLFLNIKSTQGQNNFLSKHILSSGDTAELNNLHPLGEGLSRYYYTSNIEVYDLNRKMDSLMADSIDAIICIEGPQKNGEKSGIFNIYIYDDNDPVIRYKIWSQTYDHDKLNGIWKTYTPGGILVNWQTYKNDSLNGLTHIFASDGKTLKSEIEYFNGHDKFIVREFYKNGNTKWESSYENGSLNGMSRKYYESGILQEIVNFKNSKMDGARNYYYPNGQLWVEQIYNEGKIWTVIASYTMDGQRRNAGTLNEGNGTVINYNEDGSIRETKIYFNGN